MASVALAQAFDRALSWDERGYNTQVCDRAWTLLDRMSASIEDMGSVLDTPKVTYMWDPAGIDLWWRGEGYEMLVHVDEDRVSYYGDDLGTQKFEGEFTNPESFHTSMMAMAYLQLKERTKDGKA